MMMTETATNKLYIPIYIYILIRRRLRTSGDIYTMLLYPSYMVLRQRSDSADLGTHDSGTDTSQQDTAAAVVQ